MTIMAHTLSKYQINIKRLVCPSIDCTIKGSHMFDTFTCFQENYLTIKNNLPSVACFLAKMSSPPPKRKQNTYKTVNNQ